MLDHAWHNGNGSGPVKLSDLPSLISRQLQSCNSQHDLTVQPE
jgi:hypothetical protein